MLQLLNQQVPGTPLLIAERDRNIHRSEPSPCKSNVPEVLISRPNNRVNSLNANEAFLLEPLNGPVHDVKVAVGNLEPLGLQ